MQLEKYKGNYSKLQQKLIKDFDKNINVCDLMSRRSMAVDAMIIDIWHNFAISDNLCLLAVGGYGRSELCLYSDIDLLILIPDNSHKKYSEKIANFLTLLWDIGLEVGHSVRDFADVKKHISDITVATNMFEGRYLVGDNNLFSKLKVLIKNSFWSSQSFFVAKQKEQELRHKHYQKSEYGLEPNLKECLGGLRDIHNILWITRYHFNISTLDGLLSSGFLQQNEFEILQKEQNFLYKLRFALHIINGRKNDSINFSLQKQLATRLNYLDNEKLAIEQLMRRYYRCVAHINRVCSILMQLLQRDILHTQILNERFIIRDGYLNTTSDKVFAKNSSALLEVFLLTAQNNYIKGIDAHLLRDIQANLHLIDDDFRNNKENNKIFMQILTANQGVYCALNMMSNCGILGYYIPAFGKIEGLMQYDLFHKFTVDRHTLFVLRNLRRFFLDEHKKEFLLCHNITKDIAKPELLFLAGLFHDIAKGRGGNHAKLGAIYAYKFCINMALDENDAQLVSWLVATHLLMSDVAQKQNIDDTEVVTRFSTKVATTERLNYLYLLTVADIRATNKELWNDWRASLLSGLYKSSNIMLRKGVLESSAKNELIANTKQNILTNLQNTGVDLASVLAIWQYLPEDYFIRYNSYEIAWHYHLISKNKDNTIIAFAQDNDTKLDIFIHTDDKQCVFLQMIIVLEKFSLDIIAAKVISSDDGKTFNSISMLNNNFADLTDIKNQLLNNIDNPDTKDIIISDKKHSHKHFHSNTTMKLSTHYNNKWTSLEINTIDRKGVLSTIVSVLCQLDILLIDARIATFGERVEDIFFIVDANHNALDKATSAKLEQILLETFV